MRRCAATRTSRSVRRDSARRRSETGSLWRRWSERAERMCWRTSRSSLGRQGVHSCRSSVDIPMTLDQLRIFVAVAELQHVTRAAQELGITQSGASAAIAALESRYGLELFHR